MKMLTRTRLRIRQPTSRSMLGSMVASGVGQLALVISGICAARILGAHDRGQLALLNLVPLILTAVGALGVPIATTYFIAHNPCNTHWVIRTAKRIAAVQIPSILCVQIIILVLVYHSDTTTMKIAAVISLLLAPAKLAQDYGNCILQGEQRFVVFNVTRCLPNCLYAAFALAVFIIGGGHLLVVMVCFVVAVTGAGAFTLGMALRGVPSAGSSRAAPSAGELLRFGSRAFLGAIYPTEAFQLDQALVGAFLSRVALGTYTVAVSFSNLPRFMAQSVGLVAYPHVAGTHDKRAARRTVWRFFWLTVAMSAIICGVLELLTPTLVPLLFGDAFKGSVGLTQILLLSSFIVSIRRVLSDGMRGAGYPSLGSIGEATALILLLPTLGALIPVAGVTGAALAMPISAAGGFAALLGGVALTRRRPRTGVVWDAGDRPQQTEEAIRPQSEASNREGVV